MDQVVLVGQPPGSPREDRRDRGRGPRLGVGGGRRAVGGGDGVVADGQVVEVDPLPAAQPEPHPQVHEPRDGGPRSPGRAGGGGSARSPVRDGQVLRRRPQRAQELDAVQLADREVRRGTGELRRRGPGASQRGEQQARGGDAAGHDGAGRGSGRGGARTARRGAPAARRPAVDGDGVSCHGACRRGGCPSWATATPRRGRGRLTRRIGTSDSRLQAAAAGGGARKLVS